MLFNVLVEKKKKLNKDLKLHEKYLANKKGKEEKIKYTLDNFSFFYQSIFYYT